MAHLLITTTEFAISFPSLGWKPTCKWLLLFRDCYCYGAATRTQLLKSTLLSLDPRGIWADAYTGRWAAHPCILYHLFVPKPSCHLIFRPTKCILVNAQHSLFLSPCAGLSFSLFSTWRHRLSGGVVGSAFLPEFAGYFKISSSVLLIILLLAIY